MKLLVQDMESGCAAAFTAMVKVRVHVCYVMNTSAFVPVESSGLSLLFPSLPQIPWQSLKAVGDPSSYVSMVADLIGTNIPLIRESLSTRKYFINFCRNFSK